MIPMLENKKTVIVIGAGASATEAYKFPTGEELIKNIMRLSDGRFTYKKGTVQNMIFDFHTGDNLESLLSATNTEKDRLMQCNDQGIPSTVFGCFKNFIENLKFYRNSQIDYFLRNHEQYKDLGKALIAREILKKEHSISIEAKDNWIGTFLAKLIQKAKKPEDLKSISQNLTIITFNYDLLLEYYLNEFCKGDGEWGEALEEFKKNLKIIHIYGKLGKFPWEGDDHLKKIYDNSTFNSFTLRNKENDNMFGYLTKYFNYSKISNIAKGIRVIGGEKHQEKEVQHVTIAKQYLAEANDVFFLGFGFDENNMKLLEVSKDKFKGKRVFYTNYTEDPYIEMAVREYIKDVDYLKLLENAGKSNKENALKKGIVRSDKEISPLLKLYL
jgi:hypothetical protein